MLSFISYQDILDENVIYYAHTCLDAEETLQEHIKRCEKYFAQLYDSKKIECIIKRFHQNMHFQNESASFDFLKDLMIQLVSFHDFGKINPMFQKLKMKHDIGKKYDGLINHNHSFLSSIIYIDYFLNKLDHSTEFSKEDKEKLQAFIVEHAYIIAQHHSDLGEFSGFFKELGKTQTTVLIDSLKSNPIKGYKGLFYIDNKKLENIRRKLIRSKIKYTHYEYSYKFFYYRLCYSLLVASDYYATSEFMNGKEFDIIGQTLSIQDMKQEYDQSRLMKSIRGYERDKYQDSRKDFDDITNINELRNELFLDAEKELLQTLDEHIYFLEAPTGSGKSNIALNLSFHLMKDRKKLFYIYPFNTLVEQNKNNLDQLFPNKKFHDQIVVVNSLTPISNDLQEDSTEYYQKLLLDRQFYNYPLILSTHVSLFQLLFDFRKESVIGFHQLADSVVVLDEIQSYKNKIWAEIIILLKACADLMNMKIIIMSATLPNLEILSDQGHIVKHLLKDPKSYYNHRLFKNRVRLHFELLKEEMTLEKLFNHVLKTQRKDKKILVEFLTKKSAYQFYRMLKNSKDIKVDVKCITGDDSIIEREKILAPIKENKVSGIILISTQVVEAGIDIDMDIGYKDISLLDSEEQFLGRINRSCLRTGDAYFFDYDQYMMIYKDDVRANKPLTLNDDNMKDILLNKDFSLYYYKVMSILKGNLNSSTDEEGLNSFFDDILGQLNFKEISKRMTLIDDNEWLMNVVLCRKIKINDETVLDGWKIWNQYKDLLQDNEIDYSKKQVKLIEVRSQLNYFVYKIKKNANIQYNDIIGELRCIEDADEFFVDGKLDRDKLEQSDYDFI